MWLIETNVFQMPQLHKHLNVSCNPFEEFQIANLMTELKKLKAKKPTIGWKSSLPLLSRLLMFNGFREIDKTLNDFIRRLEHLAGNTSNEKIMDVVQHTVFQLNEIDEKRQIIETSEREDLCEFIGKAARLAGLKTGSNEDITEGFRNW